MNYFNEIKNLIEKVEVNEKVRYLESNKEKVQTYYEIGRLLYEAQDGEKRAKYGDRLIKRWSKIFEEEYGKNYSNKNLWRMRQFYVNFKNVATPWRQFNLSWSHYKNLLKFEDENERNYYINLCTQNNLSVRKLQDMIKEDSFNRLSYADKKNIKLITNNEDSVSMKDMILDPIIINVDNNDKLKEKTLKKYILKELQQFFMQLGAGFALVGEEYKLKYLNHDFYIDLLLFNTNLNSYVVIELKLNKSNYKDVHQVLLYKDIVDKTLKKDFHNKTISLLISKHNDKFILDYVSDLDLFLSTYKLQKVYN